MKLRRLTYKELIKGAQLCIFATLAFSIFSGVIGMAAIISMYTLLWIVFFISFISMWASLIIVFIYYILLEQRRERLEDW